MRNSKPETPETRLLQALRDLYFCKHLKHSDFRHVPHWLITLLFEQLMRYREIDFHQEPLKDGTYRSNVLLQVARICPHMQRVVGCWLAMKPNLKWGGPVSGFFDPDKTVFVLDLNGLLYHDRIGTGGCNQERTKWTLDLNVLKPQHKLQKKLRKFDRVLEKSVIKTWGSLDWSPVQWWCHHVLLEKFSVGNWSNTRREWNNVSFQVCAKHLRIDLGNLKVDSPILLLDAALSYLGPKHTIDTLDIKVNSTRVEQWPKANHPRQAKNPRTSNVPLLAIVWKWQGICDTWLRKARKPVGHCTCCLKKRPTIRYWNVGQKGGHWKPVNLRDDDNYFDYRALQCTVDSRRFWEYKRAILSDKIPDNWFEFYNCKISDLKSDNIATLFDNFLLDIEAFTDVGEDDSNGEEVEDGLLVGDSEVQKA